MGRSLDVDPVDLRMSADHMEMHRAEVAAAHTAANDRIEAAQSGWVGNSGAALRASFVEWQETTKRIIDDVAAHGAAFQTAAEQYAAADQGGAEALDQQL